MDAASATENTNVADKPIVQSMVVVLAKNASNVRSTVSFLERRGIAAKIVATLNDAVELFSKKEANMLLLSVNFPHPKVEMLPVLMNQSFQIETIIYAEDSDRKSSARLNNAKTKHVLFGPVSGPVVMMKVRQIERELSGIDDEQAKDSGARKNGETAENDDIKVGGKRGAGNDDSINIHGKSDSEKKVALDNLMKSLSESGDADGVSSADGLKKSGETYVQKGQRSKMKSEVEEGSSGPEAGALSRRAQDLRRGLDLGLQEAPPTAAGKSRLMTPNEVRKPRPNSAFAESALADEVPGLTPEEQRAEKAAAAKERAEKAKANAAEAKERAETARTEKAKASKARERADKEKQEAVKAAKAKRIGSSDESADSGSDESGTLNDLGALGLGDDRARDARDLSPEALAEATTADELEKADQALADALFASANAEYDRASADRSTEEAAAAQAEATLAEESLMTEAAVGAVEPAPTVSPGDGLANGQAEVAKAPLSEADIIQQCLREALAIVAGAPSPLTQHLTDYKTAALVSLRTLKMSVSFIVGLAYAQQTAHELFHRIEIAFFSLLRDHGIEFENEQTYSILLDNMKIVESAFASSNYVVVSHSPEVQMGVASVVTKNPVATMTPYEENMLSVDVHDLPVGEPVTFNVFLHLKRNQKYIRYLKEGSSITAPQVTRLEKYNPNALIDQKEVEAYRRHYAAHAIQSPLAKRRSA